MREIKGELKIPGNNGPLDIQKFEIALQNINAFLAKFEDFDDKDIEKIKKREII